MSLDLDLIFRNATIVSDGLEIRADLGVKDGRVAAIGRLDNAETKREIDASGKLLMPGAVDLGISGLAENDTTPASPQTPEGLFADAVAGGATTIILPLNPDASAPFGDQIAARAKDDATRARVDFGYHYFVGDYPPHRATHLQEALAKGSATSVWVARRGADAPLPAPQLARAVLRDMGAGSVAFLPLSDPLLEQSVRAEQRSRGAMEIGDAGALFPDWAEADAIAYAGRMAALSRARVVLRGVSSLQGVRALLRLREENSSVVGMATLAHLIYAAVPGSQDEDEEVSLPLTWPPIRTKVDQQALWNALESGVIQVVGSGHPRWRPIPWPRPSAMPPPGRAEQARSPN